MLYPRVLQQVGWLLEAVEIWMESLPDRAEVRRSDLRHVVPHRLATDDEIASIVEALEEFGILQPSVENWQVSLDRIRSSEGYRQGVRDAFQLATESKSPDQVSLVVALPPSFDADARSRIFHQARDLRSTLVDLIASAERRILLASPFWDVVTVDDLAPLLQRRIAVGVRVDLLGRSLNPRSTSGAALTDLSTRLNSESCHVFEWLRPKDTDLFGTETFHLKVAIADDGARAYLGTANFTAASLRSRMEIGVVAQGSLSHALAAMLDTVLARLVV